MKSWGERFVAGLKSWRYRKNDVVQDQTADGSGGSQPDRKPVEVMINDAPTNLDGSAAQASPQVDPATIFPKEETADEISSISGKAIEGATQMGGKTPYPSVERCEPGILQEHSGKRSGRSNDQKTKRKAPTPLRDPNGATRDRLRIARSRLNPSAEEPTKLPATKSRKTTARSDTESPSEIPLAIDNAKGGEVLHVPSAQNDGTANKNVAVRLVPLPLQRQKETTEEQITDEQLAELEAENIRLKLLLRDKLNSD